MGEQQSNSPRFFPQTNHRTPRPHPRGVKSPAASLLSKKTARRIGALDKLLGLAGAHRIAEVILGDFARGIGKNGPSEILNGWTFNDPENVTRDLAKLSARWAREDAKTSANGKGGK